MPDLRSILAEAIRWRRRLRFVYNAKPRFAEPQCLGIGAKGTVLLRVHQLAGGGQREPLFDVSKIEGLQMLDETFVSPGPNYPRDDSAMVTILAQL